MLKNLLMGIACGMVGSIVTIFILYVRIGEYIATFFEIFIEEDEDE